MAKKKSEPKEDVKKDPLPTTNETPKAKASDGKLTVITTSDLKRPAQIKAAKDYNPESDIFIRSGRGEKPRRWKDGKPVK